MQCRVCALLLLHQTAIVLSSRLNDTGDVFTFPQETYHMLALNTKDKKNIHESLYNFIQVCPHHAIAE
jgi:hypothetical protein